ncbi:MAG: DUF3800 domain-containing protein [Pirellulales bacterium]|nr:DUF3800 domain-containing protein [Pirellulales bacterium]
MSDQPDPRLSVVHYYVDEAGDGTLFNRHGKLIVGNEGCSTYFMVGLLAISEPESLERELNELRGKLIGDSYFQGVPSMQPETRKTALMFHAKDDIPEVRREVFSLLMQHEMQFFAVVRNKHRIASLVIEHNKKKPTYRYHPNQLYDRCLSRLFKERLHKNDAFKIQFAKRGNRDRTAALQKALEAARDNFRRSWDIQSNAPIEIISNTPRECACLQVVDYFLWALQRLYERRESRYWDFVQRSASLVIDVDDTRENEYGEYYNKRRPLTLAALD